MRRAVPSLLLGLALLLAGCQGEANSGGAAHDDLAHDDPAHATAQPGTPHEALTLLEVMKRLERDMAGFSHALWLEDYAGMRASAVAVADHPHVSPQEMQRVQSKLGPDMARFAAADGTVHDAAVRLGDAAERHDLAAVLRELNSVQTGCVACHTQFRGRLRGD